MRSSNCAISCCIAGVNSPALATVQATRAQHKPMIERSLDAMVVLFKVQLLRQIGRLTRSLTPMNTGRPVACARMHGNQRAYGYSTRRTPRVNIDETFHFGSLASLRTTLSPESHDGAHSLLRSGAGARGLPRVAGRAACTQPVPHAAARRAGRHRLPDARRRL